MEKPGKTKKFLIKKHPDVKTQILNAQQKSEDGGEEGDRKEFIQTQTFSEIPPEGLQSMKMMSNGEVIDSGGDGRTYYYYTDSEALKVSLCVV